MIITLQASSGESENRSLLDVTMIILAFIDIAPNNSNSRFLALKQSPVKTQLVAVLRPV